MDAWKYNPAARLFASVRASAKRQGLPFDLTVEDIFVPEHCPVLGIPLNRTPDVAAPDTAPSVDRLIPALGYVKGNISVISGRANRIKTDATVNEVERVAAWMRSRGAK